jgi:hypothetical protein
MGRVKLKPMTIKRARNHMFPERDTYGAVTGIRPS